MWKHSIVTLIPPHLKAVTIQTHIGVEAVRCEAAGMDYCSPSHSHVPSPSPTFIHSHPPLFPFFDILLQSRAASLTVNSAFKCRPMIMDHWHVYISQTRREIRF